MRKIILILFLTVLTGCAPTKESELNKLSNYIYNDLGYEYYDNYLFEGQNVSVNKNHLINFITGEYSDFDKDIFERKHTFYYKEINLDDMIYVYHNDSYVDLDPSDSEYVYIFQNYEYNYLTNVTKGSYNYYTMKNGKEAYHEHYTYLYNHNTGNSECSTRKNNSNFKTCNIINTLGYRDFMKVNEDFIKILNDANIETSLLK